MPLVFLGAIACFLMPFLTVASVGRRASASGLDLAAGDASFDGTYSHAAYEGEVESVVDNSRIPAMVVFVAAFIGATAASFPGRNALRVAFTSAIVAVLAYVALLQVTSPRFSPPEADHLLGFWLAGALAAGALVWSALRLWRDPPIGMPAAPDDAPPWLR